MKIPLPCGFFLGMNILAWYIDPNDIKIKIPPNVLVLMVSKKCVVLIRDIEME